MVKKAPETIALDKTKQKRFSKRINKIKDKLKDDAIKIRETKKENKLKAEENRGLVYVGHIPHGFYENEMKTYFKQFGEVTNVKVCRSGKTGKSKGYGFVEFKNPEVAKIVADTMDNYIMFKKRLVVEFVPHEKRPKKLFHGKDNTEINYSTKRRRLKQMLTKNKTLTDNEVVKKGRAALKKLSKKLEKLTKSGINCNVEPVDVPENIKKEPTSVNNLHKQDDSDDSEVEFKIPLKASKKSVSLKQSSSNLIEGNKVLLTKSIDSVKKLLSKSELNAPKQDDKKALLSRTPKVKNDKKKTGVKTRGISKKKPKVTSLNTETVKKIARELIRKRGTPLLNIPSTIAKKKSKN